MTRTEQLERIALQAYEMRKWQKRYFKNIGDRFIMLEAMKEERKLDAMLEVVRKQEAVAS